MSNYILVVDDNPSDLLMSSFFVEKEEFVAIKAADAFKAIDQFEEFQYRMIIVDLQMPQMGGIELIQRIRRIEKLKGVPILVTSARQESKDVRAAVLAGANDYMVKPIDGQIFSEKIKRLVGRKEAWAEYEINAESPEAMGFFRKSLRIVSLSEVSVTLETSDKYEKGENLEFGSNRLSDLGMGFIVGQVNSCTQVKDRYHVKASFLGLTEESRKKIRLLCRELWNEKKKLEAA